MNRRGIFFTLLALVIVSIFILSTAIFPDFLTRQSAQKRVQSIDNFVFSIEESLPRQLFINGFRTIFILENRILQTGEYLENVEDVFDEAFFSGSVYGVEEELLIGTTFSEVEESLRERGRKINVNVSLSSPSLSVDQIDPWNVRFVLNAELLVEDFAGLALWNKTLEIESFVPIDGFDDPVYIISTNGIVGNKFVESPVDDFSNSSNLLSHATNSYYITSSSAPDFLSRLEGDLSADVNGIESLVNLQELSSQGISVQQKSVVDYIYFSGSVGSGCQISGMPSWFRLDDSHLTVYSASCS